VSTIYNYFGKDHMILVLGESPSAGVTQEALSLFAPHCIQTMVNCYTGNWNYDQSPGATILLKYELVT